MRPVPGQQFPSRLRLRKRREFLAVYDHGIRVSGPRLVLFVVPRESGDPRLGLTATRKVGRAVARNRVRRQLRDSFRRNRPRFGPWDLVVNVRAAAVGAPTVEIEAELLRLADRARGIVARRSARP